jgi:hypothetical protein
MCPDDRNGRGSTFPRRAAQEAPKVASSVSSLAQEEHELKEPGQCWISLVLFQSSLQCEQNVDRKTRDCERWLHRLARLPHLIASYRISANLNAKAASSIRPLLG